MVCIVSDHGQGEPQRLILADFSRHLIERDGFPFAIGQPAEPADPPLSDEYRAPVWSELVPGR
jgi:hypothetical protein